MSTLSNIGSVGCHWVVPLGETAFAPGAERVYHLDRREQGIIVLVLLAVLYEAGGTGKKQLHDQFMVINTVSYHLNHTLEHYVTYATNTMCILQVVDLKHPHLYPYHIIFFKMKHCMLV